MTGDATSFTPRAVPEENATLPKNHLDASVQDVTYLYDAYARDVRNGTSMASTFTDAVNPLVAVEDGSNSLRWGHLLTVATSGHAAVRAVMPMSVSRSTRILHATAR